MTTARSRKPGPAVRNDGDFAAALERHADRAKGHDDHQRRNAHQRDQADDREGALDSA